MKPFFIEGCDREWREHDWATARKLAKVRDRNKCVKCGSEEMLEINHISPRGGKGYGFGCHHHLDNLETLCHECHVIVTREQRRYNRWKGHIWDEVTVDNRKRVGLGRWASQKTNIYVIEQPEPGVIVLKPAVLVTDPEVVNAD